MMMIDEICNNVFMIGARTVLKKAGSVFLIKCPVHKCRCGILVYQLIRWL